MDMGIVTLISVVINAVAAIFAPFLAKKMATQSARLSQVEQVAATVSNGIGVIEQAVEDNKIALSKAGAGNVIASTIRQYGPTAREIVDQARVIAKTFREASGA